MKNTQLYIPWCKTGCNLFKSLIVSIKSGAGGSHTNDLLDLCLEVKARKSTEGGQKDLVAHYALGDSITAYRPSYVDYANNILQADMTNTAVGGIAVMGENQFIRQIRQIPTGLLRGYNCNDRYE